MPADGWQLLCNPAYFDRQGRVEKNGWAAGTSVAVKVLRPNFPPYLQRTQVRVGHPAKVLLALVLG